MRLVRTLCPRCREDYEVNASNLNRLGVRDLGDGTISLSRGRGCAHCRETGYFGRTGIYELLEVNDTVRGLISQNAPDSAIHQAAIETGMRTIGEDGLQKVMMGRTTLEEITRVVYLAESGVKMCPSCETVLAKEYDYCPSCGDFVGEHCEHCRRRLDPRWAFCPFCGEDSTRVDTAEADSAGDPAATPGAAPLRPPVRLAKRERRPLRRAG